MKTRGPCEQSLQPEKAQSEASFSLGIGPFPAAAQQQQEQQQRRRQAQKGASGGLGGGHEACAAAEPREPPRGVVGRHREGFRRPLRCMPVCMEKSCNRLLLVTMCARMCVMYGGRHRVIHDGPHTSVCVASCDVWLKRFLFPPLGLVLLPSTATLCTIYGVRPCRTHTFQDQLGGVRGRK